MPLTRTPPRTPPRGISDQDSALVSDVTRPTISRGIRSNCTAPSTGFRKPEDSPPTAHIARIAHSGTPIANRTNRGSPVIRKATRYVANRGSRVPYAAATTEPSIDAPPHTEKIRPTAPTPAPESCAQTGSRTADQARSSRLVTATMTHRLISTASPRRKFQPARKSAAYDVDGSSEAGRSCFSSPRSSRLRVVTSRIKAQTANETASTATAFAAPTVDHEPTGDGGADHGCAALDRRREPGRPFVRHAGALDEGRDEGGGGRVTGTAERTRDGDQAEQHRECERAGVVQQRDQSRPRGRRARRR